MDKDVHLPDPHRAFDCSRRTPLPARVIRESPPATGSRLALQPRDIASKRIICMMNMGLQEQVY